MVEQERESKKLGDRWDEEDLKRRVNNVADQIDNKIDELRRLVEELRRYE